VLDATHRLALRGVAKGVAPEEPAVMRSLAIAGLIEPVDGVWTLTQTGHAVLEIEGDGDGGIDVRSRVRDWFMT
jgi:hypothetical protein